MKTAKHIFKVLSVISFAISLTACNEEVLNESNKTENQYGTMVFTAEAPTTRTSLEADNKVYWNDGDIIGVFPNYEGAIPGLFEDFKFTTSIPEGKALSADFIGPAWPYPTESYIGFYPFEQCFYCGYHNIEFHLPETQKAIAGSFAPNINPAWAITNATDRKLQFKNIGALVKFTLNDNIANDLKSVILTDINPKAILSGDLLFETEKEESPLSASLTWGMTTKNFVTLEGSFQTNTPYYMVIAPTKDVLSNGFAFVFTHKNGNKFVKQSKVNAIKEPTSGEIINVGTIELSNATFQPIITNLDLIAAIEESLSSQQPNWTKNEFGMIIVTDQNETEVESITSIDLHYKQLDSLEGIQYFKELKTLDCSINQLTTLDVSTLTELENLYCYGNSLTTLDLSKNIRLQNLSCGNQGNGILHLILHKSMKEWWETECISQHPYTEVTYVD